MHLAALENIFFLILIAIVGLVRWLWAARESARNSQTQKTARPQAPNAPVQRAPAQTEEERVRRFMEALGVPTTNAPPPKMPRRQVTPKTPRQTKGNIPPIDPFPQTRQTVWNPQPTETPPTPVVLSTPPPLPVNIAPVPFSAPIAPVFEVHNVGGRPEEPTASALVRQTLPRRVTKLDRPPGQSSPACATPLSCGKFSVRRAAFRCSTRTR